MVAARQTRTRRKRARPAGASPPSRPRHEPAKQPRTGTKRTVMSYIAELPRFVQMLWGLVTDPRVAMLDKVLVVGAIAYILMPLDLVPDFVPFLGEVDDVYLLVLALRRLIENAGRAVLLSHWTGDPSDLQDFNLRKALMAAAFFLPRRVRRRLRVMGRG